VRKLLGDMEVLRNFDTGILERFRQDLSQDRGNLAEMLGSL
jgi:hypothetical protein